MKLIPATGILGQQGIALIQTRVLEMGFLWHATGGLEAGIDGLIELRNPATGEALNAIVLVQSKATFGQWPSETPDSFTFPCKDRDLKYWLQGNAPIVLVVSRPATKESYWVNIKSYFCDPAKISTRTIRFDKRSQSFDVKAADAIKSLAFPRDSGIYSAPTPVRETLYSNFLPVTVKSDSIWVAKNQIPDTKDIWRILRQQVGDVRTDWALKGGTIVSFSDLGLPSWKDICQQNSIQRLPIADWADSEDRNTQNDYAYLLGQSLRNKLWSQEVVFASTMDYYYFRRTPPCTPRIILYRHLTNQTSRTVFEGYGKRKTDQTKHTYYRHSAFHGDYFRHDGRWYLRITPTYHYTRDGEVLYRYYEDQLKGIKQLELNGAVLGQVLMWADFISRDDPDLFSRERTSLSFGSLVEMEVDSGINDDNWLNTEDPQRKEATAKNLAELPLFGKT